MSLIKKIDTEAIKLLVESDWIWSDLETAFIKARNQTKERTYKYRSHPVEKINYEEIRDHHLVSPKTADLREAGLKWLQKRILAS